MFTHELYPSKARAHGLTDAMGEEPSGLVGDLKHAVELVGGNTLLGRAEQVDSLEPRPKRKGPLRDIPD